MSLDRVRSPVLHLLRTTTKNAVGTVNVDAIFLQQIMSTVRANLAPVLSEFRYDAQNFRVEHNRFNLETSSGFIFCNSKSNLEKAEN